MTNQLSGELVQLKEELRQELDSILKFWIGHAVDEENGGFYGKIDNKNISDTNAPKGLVLNARILWTFSAAYSFTGQQEYLQMANRAFNFLIQFFYDEDYAGYYWSIDETGHIIDGKKQVYGIAFCLYAFAEYFKATGEQTSLERAKDCFLLLEEQSFDTINGGYFEAFTREWQPIADVRLSEKDANEKKTMNTHLHVLEAYTSLYRLWKDEQLKKSIDLLLTNFIEHIVDYNTGHLKLFFSEDWQGRSNIISYGHDIEAAWLLLEAAEAIEEKEMVKKVKKISWQLAVATVEGLDEDGGLWYEKEDDLLTKQKHWWPQAEALVGFFNAWQISGDQRFLQHVFNTWQFIRQNILDQSNGEWFWGVHENGDVMEGQDKVGFWKCPYHNSRGCLEVIKRISLTC